MKGKHAATYKNFDTSYITNYIISQKPLILKEASPEYLEKLSEKLIYRRKKERIRKLKAALITLSILTLFGWVIYQTV